MTHRYRYAAVQSAHPADSLINATDGISELEAGKRTVAFSGPAGRKVSSSPLSTDLADQSTTDNAALLDTNNTLTPNLSVNAADPADVTFTVSGLESDYSGRVTFTDTTGKADVVPIGGNGNYSTNLSNLADGTLTYLMTVSNPAGNVINVDPTTTLGDGSANAPAGAPQFPNLLSGYAVRPPWMVAGVDYAIGVPAGTVLKDPSTINIPGVTVNTSGHAIVVDSSNPVTISGIDFSRDGGWQIIIDSNNVTVTDSNFAIGSNGNPMVNQVNASNSIFMYDTFNGNSLADSLNDTVFNLSGGATIEYCLVENSPSDDIDYGFSNTIKYNVFSNNGQLAGSHPDWLQLGNGTLTNQTVEYNTFLQTAGASQGIGLYAGTPGPYSLAAATVSNNTIVTANGQPNYVFSTWFSGTVTGGGTGGLTGTATIQNNYIDSTGVNTAVFETHGTLQPGATYTVSGNVNMVTGALLPQNVTTPPISSGPTLSSIVESPSSGDLNAGKTVTLTLNLSEAVTVAGGTPTLTLNDGGTATYTGGSDSNALTFSYTVGAGQNTSGLAATTVNLGSATVRDSAGNAANLSLSSLSQSGPQIDTTIPTMASLTESPATGDLNAGKTVTLTLKLSEAVTVAGGTPTLTLNDGGTATYTGGSGTNALTFSYTVGAGQNTTALAATGIKLNSATVADDAGNATNLSLSGLTQSGPQVDTSASSGATSTGSSGGPSTGSSGATSTGSSGVTSIGSSDPTPATPTVSSLSPHNGKASGGYTTAHVLTVTGVAAANSKVEVFNGSAQLGTTTANGSGAWSFTTPSLSNGAQSFNAKDVNSAGKVSAASRALNVTVVTNASLTKVGNNYNVTTAASDPVLKYRGVNVTAGEFGTWMPIGAIQTASGYDVAWKNTSTGQYTVWTTDSNGNYTGNLIGAVSGNSYAWESIAPIFPQNLNGSSVPGPTAKVIQKDGSTSLIEVSNQFYLDDTSGSDPALKYKGANVTAGEFGGWTPIGAVKTASGYDVAWRNTSTGQYTVWTTDSNGNYIRNIGAVSGNSTALKTLEPVFGQDLNGDGVIGLTKKVIKTDGATSLTEVANRYYYLDGSSGSGPALKYHGADVTAGEFGGWTPIGAVKTASGYDVAWKVAGANKYTVWSTDGNGNYKGNLVGAVTGTSTALESLEPIFGQDLNGDGVIGLTKKVIKTDGATSLTEVANRYYYLDGSSGSGPALKYHGADVTAGEFGGWTPIGAVKTASGYDVAWKVAGANKYTVWSTDGNGNYKGNLVGAVTGTSTALESLEPIFGQDLNGDGVIGLYATPNAKLRINNSLAGSSGSTTIGTGATLELAAADTAPVTFHGTTGTLRLDKPSTFTGKIFGFRGNGSLSGSDHIDLLNIKYNSVHDSYANGVLTVTDGSGDTDKLSFNGSYTLANFKFASDGSGGTIVYDPPVKPSSGQSTAASGPVAPSATTGKGETLDPTDLPGIAFNVQSTLGYLPDGNQADAIPSLAEGIHNANIALLGNYVASIFAMASDNHGGTTTVAEAVQPHDQSVLSNPHHA